MHRTALAGAITVSAITFTQIASAADLPRAAPFYMPVFSWTGCYVGGNIGYGWDAKLSLFRISVRQRECRSWRVFRSVPLRGIPTGFSAAVRSAAIINSRPIG